MKLYLEYPNPRRKCSPKQKRMNLIGRIVMIGCGVLLLAMVALIGIMILVYGDGALPGRCVLLAFIVCWLIPVAVGMFSVEYDAEHRTLELCGNVIRVCGCRFFIQYQCEIPVDEIVRFKKITYSTKMMKLHYIAAVNVCGRRLFQIADWPENRAWMERWTDLTCDIDKPN